MECDCHRGYNESRSAELGLARGVVHRHRNVAAHLASKLPSAHRNVSSSVVDTTWLFCD